MARMQGETNSGDFKYFAGIDVSKAHLDLRVAGRTRGARFDNDAAGMRGSRGCWPRSGACIWW